MLIIAVNTPLYETKMEQNHDKNMDGVEGLEQR